MNTKKILFILLTLVAILFTYDIKIFATTTDGIISGADRFLAEGDENILNDEQIKITSDTIFNIFLDVGMVIVIIVGVILGIKYLFASLDERAEIKEATKAYALGAIVIFGAVTIWKLAVIVVQDIF